MKQFVLQGGPKDGMTLDVSTYDGIYLGSGGEMIFQIADGEGIKSYIYRKVPDTNIFRYEFTRAIYEYKEQF